MFKAVVGALLLAVLGFASLGQRATPAATAPGQEVPGQYIVILKDGGNADSDVEADAARRDHGATVDQVYRSALRGYAFRGSAQAAAAIARRPNVAAVVPDRVVYAVDGPEKPATTRNGGPSTSAKQPAQLAPTGVRRIGGSSNGVNQALGQKGADVKVAVIDTGIDLSHPDLVGVVNGKTCVSGTSSANDDNGHGTHVAGTIAARDNSIGVVGVAPGATPVAVKVLNRNGSGTWSSVICGIDYVTKNAATIKVASMSLGGSGTATASNPDCSNSNNDALHTAICKSVKAGVTYVVAAGNSAGDASNFVPAAYEEVITVSALADYNGASGGGASATCANYGADDTFASFSNFGSAVDIAAPGVCIRSTWRGGTYNTISGTSMATPHVSGAAALYIGTHAGALPAGVKAALIASWEAGPIIGDPDTFKEGIVKVGP